MGNIFVKNEGDLISGRQFALTALATTFFWCIGHLQRVVSVYFSHDSLEVIYQFPDFAHQLALGRFMQPLYIWIREGIASPFLIGVLSLLWLVFAVFLIVRLLNISTLPGVILTAGVCSTTSVLSLSYATYAAWTDVFTLALLLAVSSVWAFRKGGVWRFASIVPMVCSLGLYQAYSQVAVSLVVIILVLDCLNGKSASFVAQQLLSFALLLGASFAAYFLIYRIELAGFGIMESSEYNSLSTVSELVNGASLPSLIAHAYVFPFEQYVLPKTAHHRVVGIANITMACLLVIAVVKIGKQRKIESGWIAVFILLLVLPLATSYVYIISNGMMHDLMTYALIVPYLLLIRVVELALRMREEPGHSKIKRQSNWILRCSASGLIILCLACNVIYSNEAYLKKELEWESTVSLATRVLFSIESTPSYKPGETPVALVGQFQDSPLVLHRFEQFGRVVDGTGMYWDVSTTRYETDVALFRMVLGSNVNLIDPMPVSQAEEVKAMPTYPAKGSCRRVDGILVVRIS